MIQTPKNTAIIGAGLVGSLLAIYLRNLGHAVTVFDRRPDIRTTAFSGRSINLAMSHRGWQALRKMGLEAPIKAIALPLDKRALHVNGKAVYFQKYGREGEALWSISRGILNKRMIDLAEEAGARFRFDEKVWDLHLPEAKLYTGTSEKGPWKVYPFDLIFGCDGAFSRVRHKMQRRSRFNYAQNFLEVGYKELTLPADTDGTHKLDKTSFHIWPRGKFMLIAMPNIDGSFTCTLFLPFEGEVSFKNLTTKDTVKDFFAKHFTDLSDEIENFTKDFFKNPTSALVTIQCYPWTYWNKVALVGDAAHAIVPFYGQGMNAGFEDVYVLGTLLETYGDDWDAIFAAYQKKRKPNADAIAELSYRHFMEMSHKTADPRFLLQKKIENRFAEKYPNQWTPVYSRVTFSDRPYTEALALGDQQEKIMQEVMKRPDLETQWDSKAVEDAILALLAKEPQQPL